MATLVIAAWGDPPPAEAIDLAVNALAGGDIIGVPTDTVYGLAADPFHTGAADRLFAVKGRPRNVELPVLVCDEAQALSLCTAVPGGTPADEPVLAGAAHHRPSPAPRPGSRPRGGGLHDRHPVPGSPGAVGDMRGRSARLRRPAPTGTTSRRSPPLKRWQSRSGPS